MIGMANQRRLLKFSMASCDPYAVKSLRRVIDSAAFRIYGHWVQKSADQNRAALFENTSRADQRRLTELERTNPDSLVPSPTNSLILQPAS